MSLPYQFVYLSTETLWPYQEQVRSLAPYAGVPYSPQMVLHLCVRSLRLFRDCDAPYIRDVRIPETYQDQSDFSCRDREQLIQHIVIGLDAYESVMVKQHAESREKFAGYMAFVAETRTTQKVFRRWFRSDGGRWSRHLAPDERVNDKKLTAGLAEMEKLFRAWHGHVLSFPGFDRRLLEEITGSLYEAFVMFGPSLEPVSPVYSGRALYAAIYSVLDAFGLETSGDMVNGSRRVSSTIKRFRTRKSSQGRQSS